MFPAATVYFAAIAQKTITVISDLPPGANKNDGYCILEIIICTKDVPMGTVYFGANAIKAITVFSDLSTRAK